jgi:hypothetical protein
LFITLNDQARPIRALGITLVRRASRLGWRIRS